MTNAVAVSNTGGQLTVGLTSLRTTRLTIIRALKDLPEPRGASHRRRIVVAGLVGMLVGVGLYVSAGTQPAVAMTAPVLVMTAAIPLAALVLPKRVATFVLGSAALVWPTAVFGLLPEVMADPEISLFLLQGLLRPSSPSPSWPSAPATSPCLRSRPPKRSATANSRATCRLVGADFDDLWVIMPEYTGLRPDHGITMVGRNGVAHRAQVAGVSNLTWLISTDIYAPAHLADDFGDTGAPTRFS